MSGGSETKKSGRLRAAFLTGKELYFSLSGSAEASDGGALCQQMDGVADRRAVGTAPVDV